MAWDVTIGGTTRSAEVRELGDGRYAVSLDGVEVEVDARFVEPGVLHLIRDGEAFEVDVRKTDRGRDVTLYGTVYEAAVIDERRKALAALGGAGAAGGGEVISTSMPGKVVTLLVAEGDVVEEGQGIVVVEAMKMENELRCNAPGVVSRLHVEAGQAVEGGAPLVTLAPLEET